MFIPIILLLSTVPTLGYRSSSVLPRLVPSFACQTFSPASLSALPKSDSRLIRPSFRPISSSSLSMSTEFSTPDQPARFAAAKAAGNKRFLEIESIYNPESLKGLRIGITGANR